MLIVGELINTSRKGLEEAVAGRDAGFIRELARKQVECGATHIDVNAGTLQGDEPAALKWLVRTVQEAVPVPCCIDSPNPAALREALEVHRGKALINSISLEKERFRALLPLALQYEAGVVALCMGDAGVPKSVEDRVAVAGGLVERLGAAGVKAGDIHFDPLVQPVSISTDNGEAACRAIGQIMKIYPGVHTICGLSNISFGLPKRRLLNRVFLVQCMVAGLDGVMLDPLDREIMSTLHAAEVLANRDRYCLRYIKADRAGKLSL